MVDIFNEAADRWEQVILDPHVLILHFGWAPVGGETHTLNAQGGMPNRETEGTILFNNDNDPGHIHFYLDPTPHLDEEYLTFTESAQDLGGEVVNVARVFLDPVGDAASFSHVDLLMVALHGIGHAVGLSMANTSFIAESADGDIDVTAPRPFPGTTIPLFFNLFGVTSHIDFIAYGTLMTGNNPRERRIPSAIDILANAQISKFNDLNLPGRPPVITIAIDIKPGSFPNSINPRSKGKIPVAILTTDTFDATTVDPTTVRFGATGTEAAPVQVAQADVDGDGDTDMILHFNTQATGIVCRDTSASLTGKTFGGQAIEGSDSINKTVGCE